MARTVSVSLSGCLGILLRIGAEESMNATDWSIVPMEKSLKLSNVVLIIGIRDEWTPGMMNVDIFKETLALASLLGNLDQVITLDANFLILPNRR